VLRGVIPKAHKKRTKVSNLGERLEGEKGYRVSRQGKHHFLNGNKREEKSHMMIKSNGTRLSAICLSGKGPTGGEPGIKKEGEEKGP